MRPIRLELAGFGPYATEQRVDFNALDPVFLVTGETGAGKTTIFDAITYALYGTPLGMRDGLPVRSRLVDEHTSTWVRFRFAIRGEVWEIYRSPHHVRPSKHRGKFVIDEVHTLSRVQPDGSLENRPGNPTQITAFIADELLDLSYDDFSKVLVLPQGEFQAFLDMNSNERGKILAKLFPTAEHTRLTQRAAEQARETEREVEMLSARLAEASVDFDPATFPERRAALEAELAAAIAEESTAQAEEVAARAALHAAQQRVAAHTAWLEARQRAAELEGQRETIEHAKASLATHARVGPVLVAVDAERSVREQAHQAETKLPELEARSEGARVRATAAAAAMDGVPAHEAALHEAERGIERLTSRLADLDALATQRANAHQLGTTAAEAEAAVGPAEAAVTTTEAAIAELAPLDARREELRTAERTVEVERQRLQNYKPDAFRIHQWSSADEPALVARISTARVELEARVQGLDRSEIRVREAKRAVDAHAAAQLAAQLEADTPCPVCGSCTHPDPRRVEADGVLATERLEHAESARSAQQTAVADQRALIDALERELATGRATTAEAVARLLEAGFAEPPTWADAVRATEAQLRQMKAEEESLAQQLATRPRREALAREARASLETARANYQAALRSLDAARGHVSAIEARVGAIADLNDAQTAARAALAEHRTAADRERLAVQRARAEAEAAQRNLSEATAARDAAQQLAAALRAQATEAATRSSEALRNAGIPDEAAARAAALKAAQAEALQRTVDTWAHACTEVATRIADLESRAAVGTPLPDLGAMERAAEEANLVEQRTTERRVGAAGAIARLNEQHRRYEELNTEIRRVTGDAAGLLQLARDLSGSNPQRMTFPTFVLTWWLTRVLEKANSRLRTLSSERYRFVLHTGAQGRAQRAGLDLDVFDAYTADTRDVRSLSGGEKFLASLSLALGLADVIQERAGGIELDTLFIDEGFGSLDPEALDRALAVIEGLGEHRRVGLISHVEGVKRAVPCQLRVERSPSGSRIIAPRGNENLA